MKPSLFRQTPSGPGAQSMPTLPHPAFLKGIFYSDASVSALTSLLDGLFSWYGLLRLNKQALLLHQNPPARRFSEAHAAAFTRRGGQPGSNPGVSPSSCSGARSLPCSLTHQPLLAPRHGARYIRSTQPCSRHPFHRHHQWSISSMEE